MFDELPARVDVDEQGVELGFVGVVLPVEADRRQGDPRGGGSARFALRDQQPEVAAFTGVHAATDTHRAHHGLNPRRGAGKHRPCGGGDVEAVHGPVGARRVQPGPDQLDWGDIRRLWRYLDADQPRAERVRAGAVGDAQLERAAGGLHGELAAAGHDELGDGAIGGLTDRGDRHVGGPLPGEIGGCAVPTQSRGQAGKGEGREARFVHGHRRGRQCRPVGEVLREPAAVRGVGTGGEVELEHAAEPDEPHLAGLVTGEPRPDPTDVGHRALVGGHRLRRQGRPAGVAQHPGRIAPAGHRHHIGHPDAAVDPIRERHRVHRVGTTGELGQQTLRRHRRIPQLHPPITHPIGHHRRTIRPMTNRGGQRDRGERLLLNVPAGEVAERAVRRHPQRVQVVEGGRRPDRQQARAVVIPVQRRHHRWKLKLQKVRVRAEDRTVFLVEDVDATGHGRATGLRFRWALMTQARRDHRLGADGPDCERGRRDA